MAEAEDFRLDLDGRPLCGRTLGAGPPLLLINGYAAGSADWDPGFVAALAAHRRLICPDNRGIGGSGLGDEELTAAAMAADIVGLLDAIEIERVAVAGWSMGGFVAQELAARAPARVERLIALSTDGGGPEAVTASEAVWDRLTDHSGTPREQASRLIALLFPPSVAAAIDERFGELVAEARGSLRLETLLAQERAMQAWHREPADQRLAAIAVPALVACGGEDEVIPPANSALLATRLAGARLELFAGGGHAFMAQEPGRLAELIVGFTA